MFVDDAAGGGGLDDGPQLPAWPTADEVFTDDVVATLDDGEGDEGGENEPVLSDEDLAALETEQAEETTEPPVTEPVQDTKDEVQDSSIPEELLPYVKQLRDENKDRRLAVKPFEEAFDGYDDGQRDHFLALAKALTIPEQHEAAAREFVRIGKDILDELGIDTGDLQAPDPNRPLTVKELEAREARQAEERAQQENIRLIEQEVKDLGYSEADDPLTYYALLRAAQNHDGDFKKADADVKAYQKQIVDQFIKAQREKRGKHLTTSPAVGGPPNDHEEAPTDWGSARQRVMDMLG